MFGAITAQDVHDKLAASGVELDKRKIHLFTPVKSIGKHSVKIKLHADVSVELAFDVVSENPIEPAAPAPEAEEKSEKRRPRREPKA